MKEEKGRWVVLIADNAGGIPEDILNKVLDPLSRAIIEKNMGGQFTVRNTSDGAEFRIEA